MNVHVSVTDHSRTYMEY